MSVFKGKVKKIRSITVSMSIMLVCILLVSACGAKDTNSSQAGQNDKDPKSSQASPSPQASTEASTAAEQTAAPDAATRTVKDAFGETTIPAKPSRIVVLNTAALDNLLALGVKPIGAPYSISVNANFFKYLASQAEGVENTGTVDQPNVETIAKLNPDLIIAYKDDHEAIYEDLKRIAPVYVTTASPGQWKQALREHADAVNKSADGDKLLADFEARIAKFKADMGTKLTEKTVSLIRPRADHIRVQMAGSYSGAIVAEAGIPRPAAHEGNMEHHVPITEEQIADMDSDVIISFGRENEADFFNDKIQKNPVWKTLTAVKNNEVHMLDWETWLSGAGIQSSNLILDDLIRIFNK
ncbi:ABC transporter substrate-binding protein [Paenibacillus eucommiae]|uniref:Iron complex transport system substrate-binding protein n=1 Tax=Paenibacillus eucommiae TaxID=1355755 RepID=A0ABS4J1G0_9BACL|nr:iron-siderophore ABC transporter substrate-binding protein [Paenibacillus eucommiae]MBP1993672.1 iron complex transport system substrate-binding protein [Paenibacillus eucommiae]